MGWGRYLLLGDLGQQLDLQDIRHAFDKQGGSLGELHSIDAAFTVMIPFDPTSIRHDPAVGGGALMDLGCYPVHWLRSLLREEPDVTEASYRPNPMGADESVRAVLRFPSGVRGRVLASMAASTSQHTAGLGAGGAA